MQAGLYTETAADPLDVTLTGSTWQPRPEPFPWRRALFAWGWCLLAGMTAGVWYVGLVR